jgi:4-hydroxythreonine-4-phosphate dehydrogenase
MRPIRLALVPGEPAGVGPELCVRLAQQPRDYELTVFADPRSLRAAAEALSLPITFVPPGHVACGAGELALVEVAGAAVPAFGTPDPRNAAAVIGALQQAAAGCLRGEFDGLVTGPVHKAAINEGGIAYTGTTELLA